MLPFFHRIDRLRDSALIAMALGLAGCGTTVPSVSPAPDVQARTPQKMPSPVSKEARVAQSLPPANSGRGGYYLDDGPGEETPDNLQAVPDAEPRVEPYAAKGNKPYVVFGKTYTPVVDSQPFQQRGRGSWYGKKFHGQKTSSGELYDMYKMTAAHPTLPIPSYARVTNVSNGAQVIVRVNDRGPFHSSRVIDLSYTAALKLGYIGKGSAELDVERLLPAEIERMASNRAVSAVASSVAMPASQGMTIDSLLAGSTMQVSMVSEPSLPGTEVVAPVKIVGAGGGDLYLQLGSYLRGDNADKARAQLQKNWAATHPPIEVVQNGVLHRLYTGPFPTRTDAAAAALQIEDAGLGIPRPFIVRR